MKRFSAVLENRHLLIREYQPDLLEPFASVHYWPTRFDVLDLTDFTTGLVDDPEMIEVRNGCSCSRYGYSLRFPGCSFWAETGLTGDCKAVRFERVPVPCPKVRSGIETVWHNGQWCKRLKSGLVPVG